MDKKNKISVIIPIYKTPKVYLDECLYSVMNQSLKEIEIICILDGLNISQWKYLRNIQKADSRIKIFHQIRQGSGAARNKGMKKAQGEFISFLDSDDYLPHCSTLEELYTAAKANTVKIAGGRPIFQDKTSKYRPSWNFKNFDKIFANRIVNISECQFCWGYWCFIFSNDLIKDNKLYFPNYRRYQDPPWLIRALNIAQKFYVSAQESYIHRVGDNKSSWTRKMIEDYASGIKNILEYTDLKGLYDLHSFIYKKFLTYDIKFIEEKQGKFYFNRQNTFNKVFKAINHKLLFENLPNTPIFKNYQEYKYLICRYNLKDE